MTPDNVIDLMRSAIWVCMVMLIVIILPSLLVGLVVAVFQAATQINEQTMSFLPRLMATLIVLSVMAPWLSEKVGNFANHIFQSIPFMIG